ncbi:uncharacterized protein LOC108597311 isoform X2 [Drosophila busckii]|uniref:uncharacterized protein LOC108597311 isoform X2 n=1 Tax=Drosophila busckii TaxID=30019 RepID=UPI00083EB319|nr:uncharacterized protein LOC108597311 isoform X2 [Drosophila busckii]
MNNKERVVGGAAMSREFKRNSNAYASLPTPKTAKEQRKQQQQQQQQVQIASREPESYGLSNSLSSESIKQACDYYDDEPSDEDLIEIQQTPHGFHSPPSAQSLGFKMPALPLDEECAAFCEHNPEPPLSTPIKQSTAESLVDEEAFNVLNELDAILDVHGNCSSSLNSSATCSDDDKLEHYLMDLDNYLEQLDQDEPPQSLLFAAQLPPADARTRTLPLSGKRKQQPQRQLTEESAAAATSALDAHEFQRGHQMRKTFSCGLTPTTGAKGAAETEGSAAGEVWRRRQSLRRALGQADENTKESGEQVEQALEPHMLLVNLPSERHATQEMRRCLSQEAPPGRALQMLTEAHIFDNLLQNEQRTARAVSEQLEQRPRQYGRRLEGHPTMSPVRGIVSPTSRPQSAPAAQSTRQREQLETPTHAMMSTLCSELSSTRSSRIPSPVSMVSSNSSSSSSSGSDSFTASQTAEQQQLELAQNTQTTMCSAGSSSVSNSIAPLEPQLQLLREKCGFNSYWPHACSRSLALLGCTVGVFNLCRFAVLTINYGGNFLLQFLMLSILFGIPLFWLQMCLGAKIKAGPVSMWKISPICCGVGIALVMVQCFLAIYSTVSVAWILVYLRDVFPTPTRSVYRWQELAFPYRYDTNDTGNLTHTVAEYFNVVVLQRLHMAKDMHLAKSSGVRFHVNDRLAFYLALIWAAVFLILCKGLKSLGKLAFLINTLPLMALIAVTGKFVSVVDPASLQNIFTDLDDFLVNSNTWTAAAQETFLTWGLLGASVIAITSRTHATAGKTTLRRDAILIVLLTMLALAAVALLAICCAQILRHHGYIYVPGSFEFPESSTSVYSLQAHTNPQLLSYPRALVPHYSSFIGETYRRNKTIIHIESGFQALRFITELLPAVLSLASDVISWVWAAVAFGMFACFGLAQLCVMWKPISSALGNSTSSVLLSCVTGLLLSIPFATEMGISILYYVDFLLGGAWFIPIIWAAQIFGVFLIRGRPYNGDDLVNDLRMCGSMSAFLALSWNVLLPIGLITLSVIDYKASLSNQFYYWRGKSYFLYWSRKMGSLIQIGIVLIIPVTAIVQIYRYLTSGPADILERIQLLYRPPEDGDELRRPSARQRSALGRRNATTQQQEQVQHELQNDAPPKYTPPPSYTTATGARLAKLLRQSIRRSVRRVLGARPVLTLDAESPSNAAPPDYLTILTNPSGSSVHTTDVVDSSSPESIEIDQRPVGYAQRSQSLGRKLQRPASASSTPTLQRGQGAQEQQRPYTAEDVVTILRSSVRHRPPRFSAGIAHTLPRPPAMSTHLEDASFRSIENLVLNAEPPDQTPGVGVTLTQQRAGQSNNNTSVI